MGVVEPHLTPTLCALGVAVAAFLLVPRSAPPPIAPLPSPVVAPPPPEEGPDVVLRTLEPGGAGPVVAVFEDGTALSHWPGDHITAGPLAPELADALAALRAEAAPLSVAAQRNGCLQHGGIELAGEGTDASHDRSEAAFRIMQDVELDLRRKRALSRAPLVVSATLVRATPGTSVQIRIDDVLHAADGQPAPTPGVILSLPEHLLELSWGSGREKARVWTVEGQNGSRWWPQPELDVEQTRRDLAWAAVQPPLATREALVRRARRGVPEAPTARR